MTESGMDQSGLNSTARGGARDTYGSAKPVDLAMSRSGGLPLAGIAAAMLAASGAFFCYAMPQRVLDGVLGGAGVAAPVGGVGRTVFLLLFAALAAMLGWLAVTIAGRGGALPRMVANEWASPSRNTTPAAPVYPAGTIQGAPPPLPLRRKGDGSDAAPRRLIFADDDLADLPIASASPEPERTEPDQVATAAIVEDTPPASVTAGLPEPDLLSPPKAQAAPLDLTEPLAPAPLVSPPASGPEERTIAALMARFERGLDGRGRELPPPPSVEQIAALHDPLPAGENSLRSAIEALHRLRPPMTQPDGPAGRL